MLIKHILALNFQTFFALLEYAKTFGILLLKIFVTKFRFWHTPEISGPLKSGRSTPELVSQYTYDYSD